MSANEGMTMRTRSNVLVAAALTLFLDATGAAAQTISGRYPRPRPHRVPVSVALAEDRPSRERTLILRRANATPRDVIVLSREAATQRMLSAALLALLKSRDVHGDTVSRDLSLRVTAQASGGTLGPREERIVTRALERLRAGSPTQVVGVGMATVTELDLPARARRESMRARGQVRFQNAPSRRKP